MGLYRLLERDVQGWIGCRVLDTAAKVRESILDRDKERIGRSWGWGGRHPGALGPWMFRVTALQIPTG